MGDVPRFKVPFASLMITRGSSATRLAGRTAARTAGTEPGTCRARCPLREPAKGAGGHLEWTAATGGREMNRRMNTRS